MSSENDDESPFVGAMLRMVWQSVRDEIADNLAKAGYEDIRIAHVLLFRYPGPDRKRPSELGAQLQLSKQSVNDLLRHLEKAGYLDLEVDPVDARARLVRLTRKGRKLEKTARQAARSAERGVERRLGSQRFAELKGMLAALTADIRDADATEPRE
jgi:DNA-binding MarR family transcriptional regulator